MDKWKAQDTYWNSFGMQAYNELTVPESAKQIIDQGGYLLTYQAVSGSLNGPMTVSASLYHRSNSWASIMQRTTEMERIIDRQIPIDGGAVKFRKPVTNFAQPMSDATDPQVRRILLTVEVEFLAE